MKGMQKIKRGSGFRGVLNYALANKNGKEKGEVIGGNMSAENARELVAEFNLSGRMREDIQKPVWHNSLRLPADEKLSPETWQLIGDDYMKRMGFSEEHQRIYIMHDEPSGQHIHIIASRISLDGTIYLGRNENLLSTKHIVQLEKDYHLTITKGLSQNASKVIMPAERRLSSGEVGKAERTGIQPARFKLQAIVDTAMAGKPTAVEFVERLALAGVEARPNVNKGTLNGFSFNIEGISFKGSQLGNKYKGTELQKRGLNYEQDRDIKKLKSICATYGDNKDSPEPGKNLARNGEDYAPGNLGTDAITNSKIVQPGAFKRTSPSDYKDNNNHTASGTVSEQIAAWKPKNGVASQEPRNRKAKPGRKTAGNKQEAKRTESTVSNQHMPNNSCTRGINHVNSDSSLEVFSSFDTGNPLADKEIKDIVTKIKNSRIEAASLFNSNLKEIFNQVSLHLSGKAKSNPLARLISISLYSIAAIKRESAKAHTRKIIKNEIDIITQINDGDIGEYDMQLRTGWVREKLEAVERKLKDTWHISYRQKIEIVLAQKMRSLGIPANEAAQAFDREAMTPGDKGELVAKVYTSAEITGEKPTEEQLIKEAHKRYPNLFGRSEHQEQKRQQHHTEKNWQRERLNSQFIQHGPSRHRGHELSL